MRDIVFRGKCKETGEWVEGYLVKDSTWCGTKEKVTVIIPIPNMVDFLGFGCEFDGYWEVDPETVGQFTGLYDRTGKRIFEGDIVAGICLYEPQQVVYKNGAYWLEDVDGVNHLFDSMLKPGHKFVDVIGNMTDGWGGEDK